MIRPLFSFLESDYHSFQMLFLSLLLEPLLFFKDILTSFQKNYLIFILVGSYKVLTTEREYWPLFAVFDIFLALISFDTNS